MRYEFRTHPSAFLYLYMNGVRVQSVALRWWEIPEIARLVEVQSDGVDSAGHAG